MNSKKIFLIILLSITFLFNASTAFCKKHKKKTIQEEINQETIEQEIANNSEDVVVVSEEFEKKDNYSLKDNIMEADQFLNSALNFCEQSNYIEANENYHKFLEKLNSLNLKPEEIEFLLTDCENILRKIKNINGLDINKNHLNNRNEAFEISMDYDQEILDSWIKKYTVGKSAQGIRLALERSGKYKDMIVSILREYNLP